MGCSCITSGKNGELQTRSATNYGYDPSSLKELSIILII